MEILSFWLFSFCLSMSLIYLKDKYFEQIAKEHEFEFKDTYREFYMDRFMRID